MQHDSLWCNFMRIWTWNTPLMPVLTSGATTRSLENKGLSKESITQDGPASNTLSVGIIKISTRHVCVISTSACYGITWHHMTHHMTSYDIIWHHMTYNDVKPKNKLKIVNITCNQLPSSTLTPLQTSTCRNFRWRLGCCGDNAQIDIIDTKSNRKPCYRLFHQ